MAKKLFTSDNQPKKRPRGKSERTKFIEALERNSYSEDDFYDKLVQSAMGDDGGIALESVLKRVSPIPKQVAPMIKFKYNKNAKPHEKADQLIEAISLGYVPPDLGGMLIGSIKAMVDIEEYTDLKARIEKLEAALSGN